jgi:glucuronate isomerase
MKRFMGKNFLLHSPPAQRLYHEFAAPMPIFDYHCHLIPQEVAEDRRWENLTQIWLGGDHYKWRAMRANGVNQRFITGDAPDREKFQKWAETAPCTVRNPLYHWSHLELRRYFGIEKILSPETADEIYDTCTAKLQEADFSARNLMRRMNVKAVCTTDDPADDLRWHKQIRDDGFEIKVLPTFRPDKVMMFSKDWKKYFQTLEKAAGREIKNFAALIEALDKRHQFFHEAGCRLADHGLERVEFADFTPARCEAAFQKLLNGELPSSDEQLAFKSAILLECGRMHAKRGWVMQLHLGAMRNNNSRMFEQFGPDAGCDSIGDFEQGRPLARFLDSLDCTGELPKTILYNLNPRDNALMATMTGNFQDGSVPGKIQWGSGWWFLDQKQGMEEQLETLSQIGVLGRFVGMLTDSRSFLSYPRHEYFRRILCNLIGRDVENGELPSDFDLLGGIVQDICFNNARDYFGIEV